QAFFILSDRFIFDYKSRQVLLIFQTLKDDMEVTVPPPKKERIFFPNLDGLRFFSFFSVFLFHIWLLFFDRFQIPGTTHKVMTFLFQNGEIGVNFFFVLSGFLITG
ncbi:MAG: hypothetical protein ABIR31_04180, partial [Ginsengibacter sp.]